MCIIKGSKKGAVMASLQTFNGTSVSSLNPSTQVPFPVSLNSVSKSEEKQVEAVNFAAQKALTRSPILRSQSLIIQNERDSTKPSHINLLDNDLHGLARGRSNSIGKVIRYTDEDQEQFTIAARLRNQETLNQSGPKPMKVVFSPKTQATVAKEQRQMLKIIRHASPYVYRKIGNLILEKITNPTPCQMKAAKAVGIAVSVLSVVGGLNDIIRKCSQKKTERLSNMTK